MQLTNPTTRDLFHSIIQKLSPRILRDSSSYPCSLASGERTAYRAQQRPKTKPQISFPKFISQAKIIGQQSRTLHVALTLTPSYAIWIAKRFQFHTVLTPGPLIFELIGCRCLSPPLSLFSVRNPRLLIGQKRLAPSKRD